VALAVEQELTYYVEVISVAFVLSDGMFVVMGRREFKFEVSTLVEGEGEV